jgi:hypothetical protein
MVHAMSTNHEHRILLIVPLNRVAAVVSWLVANVDPTCPANLGPGLCAAGDATKTVTHRWQSAAWSDPDARQLLGRLCQLASITPPTLQTWNGWTGAQKRSWLASVRNAIRTNYGVYIQLSDGPGAWDDPTAALAALGLQTAGEVHV